MNWYAMFCLLTGPSADIKAGRLRVRRALQFSTDRPHLHTNQLFKVLAMASMLQAQRSNAPKMLRLRCIRTNHLILPSHLVEGVLLQCLGGDQLRRVSVGDHLCRVFVGDHLRPVSVGDRLPQVPVWDLLVDLSRRLAAHLLLQSLVYGKVCLQIFVCTLKLQIFSDFPQTTTHVQSLPSTPVFDQSQEYDSDMQESQLPYDYDTRRAVDEDGFPIGYEHIQHEQSSVNIVFFVYYLTHS